MRKMPFLIAVLSVVFVSSCIHKPQDKECRYLPDEDAYQSYGASDNQWRYIMLPNTELEMTIRTFPIDTTKEPTKTSGKKGHPLRLDEIEDQYYLKEVRVVYWQKVENGCYCIETESKDGFRPWTVWTPEVFNAVQNRADGLKGPTPPSLFPEESVNVFVNTTLPQIVTKNSADKLGKCVSDVLKGNFESKNFWIGDVGLKNSNLGQFLIEQLEKRGAKYEYENADFGVSAWLDIGNTRILRENGAEKYYREAKLDIDFGCMNNNRPERPNHTRKEPRLWASTEITISLDALVAQIEDKNVSEWHTTVEKLKPLIAQAIP